MPKTYTESGVPPWMLSGSMSAIVEFLNSQGLDAESVVGPEGIRIDEASDPYRKVDLETVLAAFQKTADITGRPDIGMELALKTDLKNWGPFFFLFLNAPTVREAMRDLCRYGTILQSQALLHLVDDGDFLGIEYASNFPQLIGWDIDSEVSICIFTNLVNTLLGKRMVPARIQFQHLPRCELKTYRKWLDVAPEFEQPSNCLLYPATINSRGTRKGNAALYKIMKRHMRDLAEREFREDDLLSFVRNNVNRGLANGTATLEHIAAEMGMPSRTLQRRLADEGTTFQKLVEDIRLSRARYYLQKTALSVTDIAMELGYAEASVFVRAFKRRTGSTPNRYRVHNATDA